MCKKHKRKKSPEIFVHNRCVFILCPIAFYISFQIKHEHNTWGGKLFVVKEIKTEFKHVFLSHVLIIFSSHNSILLFCWLCPDGKCTIKFIQPELIIFL